jgi:acyl carrier protein
MEPQRPRSWKDVEEAIRSIIADQLMVDGDELTSKAAFVEDFGVDSRNIASGKAGAVQ